ncbi:MAG TPA: NAD(P)H-binding protein [Chitinophaga sp.]
MKIVLTGSIRQIGKPLTQELVQKGHSVTVISSKAERQQDIEALGAKAAIGSMFDPGFLTATFKGADIVYLMETLDAAGDSFDQEVDFIVAINEIGHNYKQAVEQSGVKQVVHLSSIGAHMDKGNGFLIFHYNVEQLLKQLPDDVAIKFIRPVGFYTNMFSFIPTIRAKGAIISNYGGDKKEPWVAPVDIAAVIAEEMDKPFQGRTVRYVASDEVSPNEIAQAFGSAIGQPDLKWTVIPGEELLNRWLEIGFNRQIAEGFLEIQASQGSGLLYEDYYQHRPVLGKVKLADFAKDFAAAYNSEA